MAKQWITDRAEMEELLIDAQAGCLATVGMDGAPYVTPLNFLYREGCIYFHCALSGRKLDNLTAEPRVCFSVFEQEGILIGGGPCDCSTRYWSVLCFGRARLLPNGHAKAELLAALTEKYAGQHLGLPDDQRARQTGLVEIRVEEMTGKRNGDETIAAENQS